MTLNLELLAANLIVALSIAAVVWSLVLLDEREDRLRRAWEHAEQAPKDKS